jgi:bacterioferritin-associated ferredoxin
MIICVCNNVNERAIHRAIDDGHRSFDALQFETGVATCCGKCEPHAREMLAQGCRPHGRCLISDHSTADVLWLQAQPA